MRRWKLLTLRGVLHAGDALSDDEVIQRWRKIYTGTEIVQRHLDGEGKRGSISSSADPILKRLGYTPDQWSKTQSPNHSKMQKAVGSVEAIKEFCKAIGQRWIWQKL